LTCPAYLTELRERLHKREPLLAQFGSARFIEANALLIEWSTL